METLEQTWPRRGGEGADVAPVPGLLLVFSVTRPDLAALPVAESPLVLGRGRVGELELDDGCLSRRHATVARRDGGWIIEDLGSRNGTVLDGVRITGRVETQGGRVLRVGDTLFVLCADVRPYLDARMEQRADSIAGPVLQRAWTEVRRAARSGEVLHISGESGTGKELAARLFHAAGPCAAGPFVAINCATIPGSLSERLLFGARRGAYSGAHADAEGHVQASHGGTLFLDEVAELEPAVQAKLLRVLESGEVLPLGATKPRQVSLRFVSATLHDLEQLTRNGRLREDLFFRIGRPNVRLPALRERPEEIAWLIADRLQNRQLSAHVSLVEAALQRPWPGNVRELLRELESAAQTALDADKRVVERDELSPRGGQALLTRAEASAEPSPLQAAPANGPARRRRAPSGPPREVVERALRDSGGNVTGAARALGTHRTQLYRWIKYLGIEIPKP